MHEKMQNRIVADKRVWLCLFFYVFYEKFHKLKIQLEQPIWLSELTQKVNFETYKMGKRWVKLSRKEREGNNEKFSIQYIFI